MARAGPLPPGPQSPGTLRRRSIPEPRPTGNGRRVRLERAQLWAVSPFPDEFVMEETSSPLRSKRGRSSIGSSGMLPGGCDRPSQAQRCLCLALKGSSEGEGRGCRGWVAGVLFRAVWPLPLTQAWKVLSLHRPRFSHHTEEAPRFRCLRKQNQAELFQVHPLEYRSCLVKALTQLPHTKRLAPMYGQPQKSLQFLVS